MEADTPPWLQLPLRSEEDIAILMHRDSHFAGRFSLMIDYYQNGGVGVVDLFAPERIKQLAHIEEELGADLAGAMLSGPEAEKVAESREMYRTLRAIYEVEQPQVNYPRLLADLILSEEEEPLAEIQAIVAAGPTIVPSLLELLETEQLHDPLFPGYGLTPKRVLACLAQIGDRRTILALFERIGHDEFFDEEQTLRALRAIGAPAKEFLLGLLRIKEPSRDTERAAIALLAFDRDEEVAKRCLELLGRINLQHHRQLASYLLLGCAGLTTEEERKQLASMTERCSFDRALLADLKLITKEWKQQ